MKIKTLEILIKIFFLVRSTSDQIIDTNLLISLLFNQPISFD